MTLDGGEFLRRFLLHILPKGLMRIRHYGHLANRVRVKQIESIRNWLAEATPVSPKIAQRGMPAPTPAPPPKPCPNCKTGVLYLMSIIPTEKERRRYALN